MEDLKTLIDKGQFIRVDAEGEHIESFETFCNQSVENILTSLNRYPKQLIALYEKTQNKKFLNDIGLAMSFGYFADLYEVLKAKYADVVKELEEYHSGEDAKVLSLEAKIQNQDEAYEALRQKYKNLETELQNKICDMREEGHIDKEKLEELSKKYKELEEDTNQRAWQNKKDEEDIKNLTKENTELKAKLEDSAQEVEAYKVASEKLGSQIDTLRNSETTLYKRIEEYEKLVAAHEEAIKKLSVEKDSQICLDPQDVATMMNILKKYSIDVSPKAVQKASTVNPLREGVDHNTCDTNPPLVIA